MSQFVDKFVGNIDDFGMDTISFSGSLEAKLKATREAGFTKSCWLRAIWWGMQMVGMRQSQLLKPVDLICRADMPNLGLGFDSFHMFATNAPLEDLEILDLSKLFWRNWQISCGTKSKP